MCIRHTKGRSVGAKTILANTPSGVSLKRKVANQKISSFVQAPSGREARPEVEQTEAAGPEGYPAGAGGASAGFVSFAIDRPAVRPSAGPTRQAVMRPILEKQKQVPATKKIPGKRAPTLQIELELPRVPLDELEERGPAPEAPARGVAVIDFYV